MVYEIGKRNNQTVVLVTKLNGNDPFSLQARKTENGYQISVCGTQQRFPTNILGFRRKETTEIIVGLI
jgi:hypothetical protein